MEPRTLESRSMALTTRIIA